VTNDAYATLYGMRLSSVRGESIDIRFGEAGALLVFLSYVLEGYQKEEATHMISRLAKLTQKRQNVATTSIKVKSVDLNF
jgi:hypothetical protein